MLIYASPSAMPSPYNAPGRLPCKYWFECDNQWRVYDGACWRGEDGIHPSELLKPFDLSFLSKLIPVGEGRKIPSDYAHKRGVWSMSRPSPFMRFTESEQWYDEAMAAWIAAEPYADIAKMYGWPFDETPAPEQPKEKTPQERALDDFIAKREAKRNRPYDGPFETVTRGIIWTEKLTEKEKQSQALGNAMSKLTHWEVTARERIVPYRGPEL